MALSTPPTAPQRGDRATFASRVDAFITWLIGFVSELNIFSANLSTLAAGGAYAIPFTFATSGAGNGGKLTWPNYSGPLYFDTTDARGKSTVQLLASIMSSTTPIKAYLRFCKANDPGSWVVMAVTGFTQFANYGTVTATFIDSAGSIVPNDSILVYLDRVGDKGDPGSLTQVLWVRDEKASGTTGGSAGAGTSVTRTLNTVKKNTISGASLSGNQVGLPAGTYRATAFAPANNVGPHQAYLYNVTDAATQVVGTNAYAGGSTISTHSVIGEAEFTLSASKVFEIRHWTNTGTASTGLGNAVSSGQGEVYTQLFIEKVA